MLFYNRRNLRILIAIISFCISISITLGYRVNNAYANDDEHKSMIVLIDKSGSMKDTDKNRLSITAANMILDYIEDVDVDLNIITFGTNVEFIKKIKEKPSNEELKDFLSDIDFEDLETNMKDGLEEAINQLTETEGEKSILILSDGEDYLETGITAEYRRDFEKLVNQAAKEKIKLHTIGLSEKADHQKLKDMSNKTEGVYKYTLAADGLYDAFIGIVGGEEEFLTIANYTTGDVSEEIQVSQMVEEVIINVASCENKIPDVKVKVNGEEIVAENSSNIAEKYRIYRFKNTDRSSIEISSDKASKNSVIIQVKSPVEISTKFNLKNYENNITVPVKVPIDIKIDLEGIEAGVEGIYFEKYINSEIVESLDKFNSVVIDDFVEEAVGDYEVRYVAKDSSGGFITAKNINVNVNANPAYYYLDMKDVLKEGEKFNINIKKLDNQEVSGVNARLIIEGADDVELVERGGDLVGEVATDGFAGEIKYKVAINGISDGKSFGYELPYSTLNVVDKPKIIMKTVDLDKKYFKLGNLINLNLNIEEAILYKAETIEVFDESNNKIGSFTLENGDVGEISVELSPVETVSDLKIKFKASEEVSITEEIETKIYICSDLGYYFCKFKIIVISLMTSLLIFVALYIIGRSSYKANVETFQTEGAIRYRISNEVRGKGLEFILNINQRKQYLNYREKLSRFEFDIIEDNPIGYFELKFLSSNSWKWVQGLMYLLKRDRFFKVKYDILENQDVSYDGDLLIDNIPYKSGIVIKLFKRKKSISIEFI